jgi:hypothetical protein
MFKSSSNLQSMLVIFNKQFGLIGDLCDEDATVPDISKRDLAIRSFEQLRLGLPREALREEFVLESSYNKEFENLKQLRDREKRNRSDKKNIRVYGYKYPKAIRFIA